MDERRLRQLLNRVSQGELTVAEALDRMRSLPFEDIGFARVDHHRTIRCGAPEVIFCEGKTPTQVAEIARRLLEASDSLLATRCNPGQYEAVKDICPDAEYRATARCATVRREAIEAAGAVAVVTAGTSDLPVAEEAVVTAEMLGAEVSLVYDVGVAGLHRLLAVREELTTANVVVVVAGMEGALASVVGGLVARPVIAVPTSVGYGASFGGLAPLLTMLNSCAAGVSVVNIDNGFGAGYIAAQINAMVVQAGQE